MRRIVDHLRRGDWLTRGRALAYCRLFLIFELIALAAILVVSPTGVDPWHRPVGTDFISFYAAGQIAGSTDPAGAYDQRRHDDAEHAAVAFDPDTYYAFFYPPPFLLVCRVLAPFPYLAALALWLGLGAAAYGAALRRIRPPPGTLLVAFAFPACFLNAGHGQNGFATAALFAAGTALLDRRPWLAGGLFGLLCCKPHLALLVPVALLAGRHWRAAAAAACSALLLGGLATALFGGAIWPAYLATVPIARHTFATGGVDFAKMASVYGALQLVGAGADIAAWGQAAASAAAALAVGWIWWRPAPVELRHAALVAGALVASPLLLDYDLVVAAVAAAWLVRRAELDGFGGYEKTGLALLFAVTLVSRPIGIAVSIPLAAVVGPTLLILAVTRLQSGRNIAL